MDKINEIKKVSSSIDEEIERKLYCIKSYNSTCDQEFINSFNFKFIIRPSQIGDGDMLIQIDTDTEIYIIEKKSRLITFIINKVHELRFIYSCDYLKKIINDYDIQYYSTRINNNSKSEISDSEILDLFNQEDISNIYKIESNNNGIISLFKNRYNIDNNRILDLSLNAGYYYPENANDELNSSIFDNYLAHLKRFIWKSSIHIIYLLGPKGASKSLFLMNFCLIQNLNRYPTLYINYKILKNLEPKMKKKIFKKEMIYLFFKEEIFKDFYKAKCHRIIKDEKNDFIYNLTEFIKQLINIYKNYFEKKILLVIDNFNEDNENLFAEMEQLIKFINSKSSQIKLIISGNSDFLKKKFTLFLDKRNLGNIIDNQILFIYDLKLKNHNDIKSLVDFNYRKNINDKELEDNLIKEEIQYCKKYNLYGMHYSVINNGKKLKLDELLKYIYILPFEYLTFSINEDQLFSFEYFNPIFLKAVKKYIKFEIKEKSLNFLLSNDNKDFLINGIYEEKLLSSLISYNKLNLENMKTSEDNLLEVNKICEFKDKKFSKINKKIDKALPIIITQEIFLGELYDLLILIPNKENDIYKYIAYLIQIGTNKPKDVIDTIKRDFNENKKSYISGIKKFIDNNIEITDIELLFIFDKETQEKLNVKKAKINEFGSKYCIQNNIKFYCFSLQTYELYKTFDNIKYYKITDFGDFNKYIKKKWLNYLLDRLPFSEEEIKFINSKISGDITNMSSIFYKKNVKFTDIKDNIEKDTIYVLENEMNKYFIINCDIYNYIDNSFTEINKKDIDKQEKFDLCIISYYLDLELSKRLK